MLFTQATKQFLEEINKWTVQYNVSPLSWNVAVKFLMARKFDVLRAVELFHCYRVSGSGPDTWVVVELSVAIFFLYFVHVDFLLLSYSVKNGPMSTNSMRTEVGLANSWKHYLMYPKFACRPAFFCED